jgi:SAM domain (Sterile alpha motif)
MQQIADWLQNLGMSEYAQRFAENRIDFAVLPQLTDQDLKDLGVVLGDRRKILRAIAGLKSTEAVSPNSATEAVIAPPQETAERRQVTVMFSDLVGSTALKFTAAGTIAGYLPPGQYRFTVTTATAVYCRRPPYRLTRNKQTW